MEKDTATHSSLLAWRIPWTEEPGGLQSMGGCKESEMTEQLALIKGNLRLCQNSKGSWFREGVRAQAEPGVHSCGGAVLCGCRVIAKAEWRNHLRLGGGEVTVAQHKNVQAQGR